MSAAACQVPLPPPEESPLVGEDMPLNIVFEDEHLLVVDKPAGLVVHPAPGSPDRTLVNALLAHCGESLSGIGGVKRPGIVHRLDKDTSGLIVVAKSEQAQTRLAADFAARRIARAYQAIVWGVPSLPSGELTGNIGRSPKNRKKMAVLRFGGKTAMTRYRVLRRFKDRAALLECRLATGRTHQIRVHLTAVGHPLIGDQSYGNAGAAVRLRLLPPALRDPIAAFNRQALHAAHLGFHHPASGEYLEFTSRLPSDMRGLVDCLERL